MTANTRLTWLAAALALWGLVILTKLVDLQVLRHEEYARLARAQQMRLVDIPAPRGDILDRNRQTLARSVAVETVFVNPLRLVDVAVAAEILAPVLGLDRKALDRRLRAAKEAGQGFLRVKRRISRVEAENLKSLQKGSRFDWIEFEPESQRHYPKRTTAAHVLGSVDADERGNAGIEQALDDELRGRPGAARMLSDVRQRGIESHLEIEPKPGTHLVLTIDERIQFVIERELKEAVPGNHCQTGSAVVLNPHTGEILGLASYPSFDPNRRPVRPEDQAARLNVAVSAPGEPGSVFKVFAVAAAMERTGLHPETVMPCGRITLGGRLVHEAGHFYGPLTVAEVLERSSNAGAAQIGKRLGPARLYEAIRKLGFGQRTGVPLPAESPGMLRKPENWDADSDGYIAFGHEVAATTLQLAQACSVMANGGLLVKPKLVMKKQRPGGEAQAVPSERPVRVLAPETAIALRRMMEGVVLQGTGKTARLEGYTSGGKTGSAQIYDHDLNRYTHLYNASFMGFTPVTNPAIVVVVTLNGAREYGGAVAAPVFARIATEVLRVLDVPKDLPETEPSAEPVPEEQRRVAEAPPVRLAPVLPPPNPADLYGPRVPDFQGKTMRAVVEEAAALGIPVVLDGTGIARAQAPPAGAILPRGARIRVVFAR